MARAAKNTEATELAHMLQRISDEKVRYFYLMLGDALAQASEAADTPNYRTNTSPAHIADIAARMGKS